MTYHQLEEAIFNKLQEQHELDPSFTFSVRMKASEGAQRDYFIGKGKEGNGYIGFTLWRIPIAYPGASVDFSNFIVWLGDGKIGSYFQILTPNSGGALVDHSQLAACLQLAKRVTLLVKENGFTAHESAKKMLAIKVLSTEYADNQFEELWVVT